MSNAGRKPTVAEWIAENAYRYDLTSTRSDSGEDGWVDYQVANEAGIAQMYEDMIAAGVGLTSPAREATPCGAWWNDPDSDTGYRCERERGHDGEHWQKIRWEQQPLSPPAREAT